MPEFERVKLQGRDGLYWVHTRRQRYFKFGVFIQENEIQFFKDRDVKVHKLGDRFYIEVRAPMGWQPQYSQRFDIIIRFANYNSKIWSGQWLFLSAIRYYNKELSNADTRN